MRKIRTLTTVAASVGLLVAACSGTTPSPPPDKGDGIDENAFADTKGDVGSSAEIVDDIKFDSTVEGTFDPRVRAYGYTFDVKKGANLEISLDARAGSDARGLGEGEKLDTVLALYQGFEGPNSIGEKIVEHDDGDDSVAAPPIQFEVEETGTYFLAFTSYDDTGTGKFEVDISCSGTDLQCNRPNFDRECEEGESYIQGGVVEKDTTWETCNIVLLEPTRVEEDAILTVQPGVTVRGNFLSEDNSNFGEVSLDVAGSLQAVGTEENPIAFTAFKEEQGWQGLRLRNTGNTLEHVYIEKAENAVRLSDSAVAEVRHAVIEGHPEHQSRRGIWAEAGSSATFTHAAVKNFREGIRADHTEDLLVEHSVVRDNRTGVEIIGEDGGSSCGGSNSFENYRDPVLRHTDIFDNRNGIHIDGSDIFVQVEKSNIVNNERHGLTLEGSDLADGSYLRHNNIYGNNGATAEENNEQVETHHHQENTLVLEDNYWRFISDPELRQSWDNRCDGEISFTGFSEEPIEDAGPQPDTIVEPVQKQSWAQASQSDDG